MSSFRRAELICEQGCRPALCDEVQLHGTRDMTKADVAKLLELPLPERFELAQTLWGSIETEWSSLPVTDHERRLLDESLEAYDRDPDAGIPWPEAKAELLREL